MAKFTQTMLLTIVIVGGVYLLLFRDQLQHPGKMVTQLQETVRQKLAAVQTSFQKRDTPPSPPTDPVIRIATFKLNTHSTSMDDLVSNNGQLNRENNGPPAAQTHRLRMLAEICSRYDAIALQGIAGTDDAWLQMLTVAMNATGSARDYYFITDAGSLPVGSSAADALENGAATVATTQNAIVFNRQTLEMDPFNWYTVNDPDGLLNRSPLVAPFRVRVPQPQSAFTFTLANLEMSAHRPDLELAHLGELFRAIRNDGRGEDDVILAGDFNAGERGLGTAAKRSGLMHVIAGSPTDIRRSGQFDNLLFSRAATREFTGKGGTYDFLRANNLRLDEAELLSERMPVWAEFSIFEGQ